MPHITEKRAEPQSRCIHFGECGGCQHQDVPYPAQLAAKQSVLEAMFAQWWAEPIEVTPSPETWHYRNKVDFSFGLKFFDEPPPKGAPRPTVLGFKRKGKWFWPLEIEECLIAPPGVDALLAGVRRWVEASGLPPYDSRRNRGMLKGLLVREGKRTGERMVCLLTRPGDIDGEGFKQAVLECFDAASISWGESASDNEAAFAETLHALHGPPHIHEELLIPAHGTARRLRFRISPMSFFQTNTLGTELLYGTLRELAAKQPGPMLYDLYGGSGGIAFACADQFDEVVSVENVEAASEDGRYNAQLNGMHNVAFETADVPKYLQRFREGDGLHPDGLVICDPPRAGLQPKALRRLIELAPPRILYISCKPSAFAGEMQSFSEHYALTHLSAVDLFPHTEHVEVVAELVRQ